MQELAIKKRYYILDIIRAVAIINMVAYHFLYDLYNFGLIDWFFAPPMNVWQQCICITFIFLSGFCFQLGRRQWKRGLIILGCAVALSLVTFVMEIVAPGSFISFGILCFMASATLITVPLHILFKKVKYAHWVGFFACLIAFVLLKDINNGTIIFGSVNVPESLYHNYLTSYLGFPSLDFASGDYFAILPWIFLYLTGYFAFSIAKQFDLLKYLSRLRCKPLEFIGRHSLIIYMAHQVVLFPVAFLISIILQS